MGAIVQLNTKCDPAYAEVTGIAGGSLEITSLKINNYNASIGDFVRCDPTTGQFTVSLPSAAAAKGEIVIKVQSNSNNGVLIAPKGGDTIDGVAGVYTAGGVGLLGRECITLWSDGVSDWMVQK